MSDAFKKVQVGQRLAISAKAYNAFLDMVQGPGAMDSTEGQYGGRFGLVRDVKNDTGEDLGAFAVVGLDGIVYTRDQNQGDFESGRSIFSAVKPTVAGHIYQWAICLHPIADGGIGPVVLEGVSPVQIDMKAEYHKFANITHDETARLTSASGGVAEILWKESGTGVLWALVRFPFRDQLILPAYEANDAPATIPAESFVVSLNGWHDGLGGFGIRRPNYPGMCNGMVTLSEFASGGGYGLVSFDPGVAGLTVKYDGAVPPVAFEKVGTKQDAYTAQIGRVGWRVIRSDSTAGVCWVVPYL